MMSPVQLNVLPPSAQERYREGRPSISSRARSWDLVIKMGKQTDSNLRMRPKDNEKKNFISSLSRNLLSQAVSQDIETIGPSEMRLKRDLRVTREAKTRTMERKPKSHLRIELKLGRKERQQSVEVVN